MRKLLLVTFIGMVLVINLYGLMTEAIAYYDEMNVVGDHGGYTVVYVE